MSDVRYALRSLVRTPGFAAVVVLTLGLGIGANTAIFSVVNAILLRPLPYPDADRLVRVVQVRPPGGPFEFLPPRSTIMSTDDLLVWRERATSLSSVALYSPSRSTWTAPDGAVPLADAAVSPGLFELLGVEPLLGRTFTPDEESPAGRDVVVLSHRFWQQRLGGDPRVIGQPILLDERPHAVVGVMPEGFEFPSPDAELWRPFTFEPTVPTAGERIVRGAQSLARLADGVTLAQATAEANVIHAQLREADAALDAQAGPPPGARRGGPPPGGTDVTVDVDRGGPRPGQGPGANVSIELVPVQDELVAPVRPALLVLLGAVGFVLLIACANVANLMLVRAAARRRELAVRAALGASRARLARQALTESGLLALLGGALGVALAWGAVRLVTAFGPDSIPRLGEIAVDGPTLAFTAAAALAAGLLFGFGPALHASRGAHALHEGVTASSSGFDPLRRHGARSLLTMGEVALAMMLLVGAALLTGSFTNLVNVDPGYDPDNLLTFRVDPPGTRYDGPQRQAFFERVRDELRAAPGVETAATALLLPLQPGGLEIVIDVEGQVGGSRAEDTLAASVRLVSEGYVEAMRLALADGRAFGPGDGAGQPLVLMVNQTLADRYFPGERAVGRTLDIGPAASFEIVGIVGDVRHAGLDAEPEPEIYLEVRQAARALPGGGPGGGMYYVVRTTGDPVAFAATARGVVQRIDPAVAIDDVASMGARLSTSVAQPRFYAALVALFGLVALALATVGIYGVMAYSVAQRTREIGIRMALGARARQVLGLVLRQGAIITGAGIVAGLAGAAAITRYLEGLLFGLDPLDTATFMLVALLFAVVAALACYLPAARAARVDPATTLRAE